MSGAKELCPTTKKTLGSAVRRNTFSFIGAPCRLVIIEPMATAPLERHLLRARDLIDGRYADRLDLEAMADAAHVSPRHFSRSFRRTFGETPHQYLISRRLERAQHLLRTTDDTVAEICLAVGFTSVGSFTTTFTRHVGVSPTTYRRASASPSAADYIPLCAVKAWTRRPLGANREDSGPAAG